MIHRGWIRPWTTAVVSTYIPNYQIIIINLTPSLFSFSCSRRHNHNLLYHPDHRPEFRREIPCHHRRRLLRRLCVSGDLARTDSRTGRHCSGRYWYRIHQCNGAVQRNRRSACLQYRVWADVSCLVRHLLGVFDCCYCGDFGIVAACLEKEPEDCCC